MEYAMQTERDIESIEIINQLKIKWGCETDKDLADELQLNRNQIYLWKRKGIGRLTKRLLEEIIKK